jgi:hypothetical protein
MSDLSLTPSGSPSYDDSSETLTDRVALRVMNARLAIEGRQDRRQPKGSRPGLTNSQSEAELRETASLKRVFREFGTSYRRYRSQTGKPVVPELREAAHRFRAAPSLASLVVVATYLEELDLLN